MEYKFSFVSSLPDAQAFQSLMTEYYDVMSDKLANAGGPQMSPTEMAKDTMAHIHDLLPPHGRTLLAHGADGRLVGCGVIRKIRPDAAELKRMYIRPEAQGMGLGRRLFEMRIDEAKKMGWTTLFADTVKGNKAMLTMYEKYGFTYIDRYPENANGPELAPYLVFLQCKPPKPG